MFNFFCRKARKEACQQTISELFRYNQRDYCWDPVGSIDHNGALLLIESVSRGMLREESKRIARSSFNKKRAHNRRFNEFQAANKGAL